MIQITKRENDRNQIGMNKMNLWVLEGNLNDRNGTVMVTKLSLMRTNFEINNKKKLKILKIENYIEWIDDKSYTKIVKIVKTAKWKEISV